MISSVVFSTKNAVALVPGAEKLPENMTFSLETYPYRLLSALRFVYFGKLLQKHLLFELHVILSEILFVSEFQKSANDRLDFKFICFYKKG